MTFFDQIETLVVRAETSESPEPLLQEARELLAQLALAGTSVQSGTIRFRRLEALVHRCSKNSGDQSTPKSLIPWGGFMGCVVDFMDGGVVCMKDGRVATADGWDYSNCEPENGKRFS